jgi:type III pantothenate kinase
MTTLLIDLGNTALKWTTREDPDNPHTIVHQGSTHFKEELYKLWLEMHPDRVIGCTVAAPVVAFSLTKFFNDHGISWIWARPQDAFHGRYELRSTYKGLGADRWFAAIGAVHAMPEEKALLVCHLGTATTVDAVVRDSMGIYQFRGGRISPGPSLMQSCLTHGQLALPGSLGPYSVFPNCTSEAITTGIVDAQVGLILRARATLREKGLDPKIIIAGGAAQFIEPHLRKEVPDLVLRHNLVLLGLAELANNGGKQ